MAITRKERNTKDVNSFDEQDTTLAMGKGVKGDEKPVIPTVKDLEKTAKKTYMYPSWSNRSPSS